MVGGPTDPARTCWLASNPVGTSGPIECAGGGVDTGVTDVVDASELVVEGDVGAIAVKPPHAGAKSVNSRIAATLGSFMAQVSAIPDAPPRPVRPGVYRPGIVRSENARPHRDREMGSARSL